MAAPSFLPSWLYTDSAIAQWEQRSYAHHFWHPIAAASQLLCGQVLAVELLGRSLLLTRTGNGDLKAFYNCCPHRGVALLELQNQPRSCRKLVCPYHGWTFGLDGSLLAAAREASFESSFHREEWGLTSLLCQEDGPLIWVALGERPVLLSQQLELIHREAPQLWFAPLRQCSRIQQVLHCNWKIAHDNTLDDYHVAIAHPMTLHREQGPVRDYCYGFTDWSNLLSTPHPAGGAFLTFGLAPWTHVLIWPDGRLAMLEFLPLELQRCRLQLRLLAPQDYVVDADLWLQQLIQFLAEDRCLVESAQIGYSHGFDPGPPHRLEQRILQWQDLYRRLLIADQGEAVLRSHAAMR